MKATGVRWFTMAFLLSDGGCRAAWDGTRPLRGGVDEQTISRIRSAGGDVVVSFGGWSGAKLGERCDSATALAKAYQEVIDAHRLKAIDIDIESTEFENDAVQQRVIDALKIVKRDNPGVAIYLTMPTEDTGPSEWGRRLIGKGSAAELDVTGWVIMPFNFGGGGGSMRERSIRAADGLASVIRQAYGYSSGEAYRRIGISSMNGVTDAGERITQEDFRGLLGFAQEHRIARFTFWSANRDRPCGGGTPADACSGISQQPWEFTKIVAGYR